MNAVLTVAGQLRLVGAVLVLIGVAHVVLPSALGWPAEFTALRPLTRRIMSPHTCVIGVICIALGLVPLALTDELLAREPMAKVVLAAECLFWALRWCAQFVAFPPALWRNSRLYTASHIGFSLLWTWIVAVFVLALATGTS
jgi:hypothetical protein